MKPVLSTFRYWLALHPDVKKPIGGVKQMHRLAEALRQCGRDATIIQDHADFHPGWFSSSVETIGQPEWSVLRGELSASRDVVVLPETFLPVFETYAPGIPKVIFNQNGAYTFGLPGSRASLKPSDVISLYRHPELHHVLCVSQYDENFLSRAFQLDKDRLSRLVNCIDGDAFRPIRHKRLQIAYMPRKNAADAAVVAALLEEQPWFKRWNLLPIHGRSQAEVASILQESLIFLAFGHPEGFGLPIAESLACGCFLVGYSGLGGSELFALADQYGVGQEVPYGDWFGFVDVCERLDRTLDAQSDHIFNSLLKVSKLVRNNYSDDAALKSVQIALSRLESSISTFS